MTDIVLYGSGIALLVVSLALSARVGNGASIRGHVRPLLWMYVGTLVGSLALALALCFTPKWEAWVSVNADQWFMVVLPITEGFAILIGLVVTVNRREFLPSLGALVAGTALTGGLLWIAL